MTREDWSLINAEARCLYICRIVDDGNRPMVRNARWNTAHAIAATTKLTPLTPGPYTRAPRSTTHTAFPCAPSSVFRLRLPAAVLFSRTPRRQFEITCGDDTSKQVRAKTTQEAWNVLTKEINLKRGHAAKARSRIKGDNMFGLDEPAVSCGLSASTSVFRARARLALRHRSCLTGDMLRGQCPC